MATMKRPAGHVDEQPYKKHKSEKHHHKDRLPNGDRSASHYDHALSKLPQSTSISSQVPAYTHFTVPKSGLPELPPIKDLTFSPFKHKSMISYSRSSSTSDVSYERLEFLGDAYIELIASRLIFERFFQLTAGQMSQLRELLVKNETLAEYSKAYGFDKKLEAGAIEHMMQDSKNSGGKGNKAYNKVMGDVFEAYVAAVVLSDVEEGFAVAEKWLTTLWVPKLVEAAKDFRAYSNNSTSDLLREEETDPRKTYSPTAKADLQKLIMDGARTKLEYEKYQDPIELKGDKLGQNRHFIALHLTGYGYEKQLLGRGEGKNKVEAGNWAAIEAMYGEAKGIVQECAEKLKALREDRKAQQAESA